MSYIPNQIYYYTRTASAVDGSVQQGSIDLDFVGSLCIFWNVTVTGSPATLNARCAVETYPTSPQAVGTALHQVARFIDITSTSGGDQVVRLRCCAGTQTQATVAGSDLTAAAATATVVEGPISNTLSIRTYLPTLTGGTAPTVTFTIWVVVG